MSYIILSAYGARRIASFPRVRVTSSSPDYGTKEIDMDMNPFTIELPAGSCHIERIVSEEEIEREEQARINKEKQRRIDFARMKAKMKAEGKDVSEIVMGEAPEEEDKTAPLDFTVEENTTVLIKMTVDWTGKVHEWNFEKRESTERDGFVHFRNLLKAEERRISEIPEEEREVPPFTISRGNKKKATAVWLSVVITSFTVLLVVAIVLIIVFREKDDGQAGVDAVSTEADDGTHSVGVMKFLDGKWYCMFQDGGRLRVLDFRTHLLTITDYDCEIVNGDDGSGTVYQIGNSLCKLTQTNVLDGQVAFTSIDDNGEIGHYGFEFEIATENGNHRGITHSVRVDMDWGVSDQFDFEIATDSVKRTFERGDIELMRLPEK